MYKTFFIITFIFFGSIHCLAQKTLQKEFSAKGVNALIIRDDAIFKLHVETSKTQSIKVVAHIYGENASNVVIEEKLQQREIHVNTGFSPYFEKTNDKLAANKVMSIEMEIVLPEQMALQVESRMASVIATGNYKNIEIGLAEGNCELRDFKGNAILLTKRGNITVQAQDQVTGDAFSRHGNIKNILPRQGKYHIKAESINGSIFLFQTK